MSLAFSDDGKYLLAAGGARLRGSAVLTAALNLARRWGREEVSQLLEAAM